MDVMYCGDKNILDGLTISVLSLLKNTSGPLRVYVLTMIFSLPGKKYQPIMQSDVEFLSAKLKEKNHESFVKVIDVTEFYKKEPATANRRSYFTPYCMLRLYADQIPEIPDKILYLDTDIVCLKNPMEFYKIDNSKYEMVGVLDRYGGKIIRFPLTRQKYINSGVLLLNLPLIRETKLFYKAREMCRKRWMIMPDQSALNFSVKYKKIVDKKFNDQKEILPETVFRHFSNTFKFFPYFKVIKIKPWDVDKVHNILDYHQFDDILDEWQKLKAHKEVA